MEPTYNGAHVFLIEKSPTYEINVKRKHLVGFAGIVLKGIVWTYFPKGA